MVEPHGEAREGTSRARGLVSLRDVQRATPMETAEESSLLENIDRNDPTGQSSLLLHLAAPLPPEMTTSRDMGSSTRFLRPNSPDGDPKTVAEELFSHTKAINRAHFETGGADENVNPPANVYRDEHKSAMTQADTFAANAGKLFHRFSKAKQRKSMFDVEHGKKRKSRARRSDAIDDVLEFGRLIGSNKESMIRHVNATFLFCIIPATFVACLLFYVFNNPGVGSADVSSSEGEETMAPTISSVNNTETSSAQPQQPSSSASEASSSWWLLFLLVRQVFTFGLARGIQYLVVALSLRVNGGCLVGPLVKLFILQARGVPLQLVIWVLVDFACLFGNGRFPNHWLFYQSFFGVFNEENPSGGVTGSRRYRAILLFLLCAALAVAVKRFYVGLRFGKASYHRYAEKLSIVLKQIVHVTNVARLGSHEQSFNATSSVVEQTGHFSRLLGEPDETNKGIISDDDDDDGSNDDNEMPMLIIPNTSRRSMTDSAMVKINELLGDWEEPDLMETTLEDPSLSSLIQFRASVSVLDTEYPFSQAFGCARTRVEVIECAQRCYFELMGIQKRVENEHNDHPLLKFHTIALCTMTNKGDFDRQEAKALLKLFRPARNGDITLLDFCKSIDCVYKEMRKLRANIANEGRMNAATERILNVLFYFLLTCIGLAVAGINPFAFFGMFSSFLISFSFMFKQASSNYFRGLLFVLVQRPYDIGDRINVAGVNTTAATSGSPGWIVKDVTLYYTTVVFGTTQEYATFANGAISKSRIINSARSPRGLLQFTIQFDITVDAKTIEAFREALVEYVRSKPREWLAFTAFRMSCVEASLGYVEFKATLQHRESWQQVAALQNSLADVQQQALNLSKSMGMDYSSPPLPVEVQALEFSVD